MYLNPLETEDRTKQKKEISEVQSKDQKENVDPNLLRSLKAENEALRAKVCKFKIL
jgi:hypothetical protein